MEGLQKIKGKNYLVKNTQKSVVLILQGSEERDHEGVSAFVMSGFNHLGFKKINNTTKTELQKALSRWLLRVSPL